MPQRKKNVRNVNKIINPAIFSVKWSRRLIHLVWPHAVVVATSAPFCTNSDKVERRRRRARERGTARMKEENIRFLVQERRKFVCVSFSSEWCVALWCDAALSTRSFFRFMVITFVLLGAIHIFTLYLFRSSQKALKKKKTHTVCSQTQQQIVLKWTKFFSIALCNIRWSTQEKRLEK